jgi:hypothetical protein
MRESDCGTGEHQGGGLVDLTDADGDQGKPDHFDRSRVRRAGGPGNTVEYAHTPNLPPGPGAVQCGMTAKQALRERVERLSEEEAAEWLARFEWESTETETLTDEEMDRVLAAEREFAEGESVGGEEVFRKLGL